MKRLFTPLISFALDRSIPLNDRLSARMVIASAFASFFGMIVCILAHTHIAAVCITGFLTLYVPTCYVVLLSRKKIKFLVNMMLVGLFVLMPPLWIFGGGLHSGMTIWILYELVLFTVSLSGKIQTVGQVVSIATLVECILLEEIKGIRYPLPSPTYVIISVLGSVIVAGGIIVYMTNYQKTLYAGEFELVEKKNEELVVYAERAEKANKSQKVFLANMSHEIRSPMNVVLGFNHLICESNDVAEIHDFAKNIESAGESLLVIVNDILDYSKIETGKMNLYTAPYSFRELVQMCCSSIEIICKQKNLEFSCDVDPSIPKVVYGDKMRLRQCITNLLTNSFKYTDEGSVHLKFTNVGLSEDKESIMLGISVKDTGRGISEEQKKELFTRFQRLDESTNRAIEGTGLGLALTKSFVDMMGGTIECISEEHKGSEFIITIPQRIVSDRDAAAQNVQEAEEEQDTAEKPVKIAGLYVLIVDDSSTNLVLMKHLLKQLDVRTVTASSGLETLERVKNDKFDLIFMDHMMPHMDGVETFRRMKTFDHMNKETPVVMLTANAMSGAEEEYLAEGFAGYLSKPVKFEAIKEEIIRIRRMETAD